MDKDMGLIFSLLHTEAYPVIVPYMHHGFTFVLPCVPVAFTDNARC